MSSVAYHTSVHVCRPACQQDTADLAGGAAAPTRRVSRSLFTRRPGERRVCELHQRVDGTSEVVVHGAQMPWRQVTPSIWSALQQQCAIERALTGDGWVLTRFCAADVDVAST